MPQVGFEPTIPVFERAKTVHTLDRPTTVVGLGYKYFRIILLSTTSATIMAQTEPPR
jgi:hypothetical protein